MHDVAIIGLGQTPVNEHWDRSLRELAAEAIQAAIDSAGAVAIDALYIANAYGGPISSQTHLGPLIADYSGLNGVEAYTIEAAEASGGAALRTAYLAVASGAVETALVVGVEKLTDSIAGERVRGRNMSLDADFEAAIGTSLNAQAGLLMRRYMHEYGLELDAFEGFSINAHANGSRNPLAMFRNQIKPGRFAGAPMVSDPVNLFDSAPDADGAAAVVLTRARRAVDLVPQPVRITGSGMATDTLALHDRTDMLFLRAAQRATQRALHTAGKKTSDIDLFELHDAFTVLSALSLEAAGFAARGAGWQMARDNAITLTGTLPISTFGGLKARGNPAGASGVYQAVEACLQLRGEAGPNQITNVRTALIQSLGGLGSTAVTHVLQA